MALWMPFSAVGELSGVVLFSERSIPDDHCSWRNPARNSRKIIRERGARTSFPMPLYPTNQAVCG